MSAAPTLFLAGRRPELEPDDTLDGRTRLVAARFRGVMEALGFLDSRLSPAGVMIVIEARHFCMEMRGVRKALARTTTSAVRGGFADAAQRHGFLARVRGVS